MYLCMNACMYMWQVCDVTVAMAYAMINSYGKVNLTPITHHPSPITHHPPLYPSPITLPITHHPLLRQGHAPINTTLPLTSHSP